MLAGENEHGTLTNLPESTGERSKLDRFGTGSDYKPDFTAIQAFPLARLVDCAAPRRVDQGLAGSLAEIVRVGLDLEPWGNGGDKVIFKAVSPTIFDRRIRCREGQPNLGPGVARTRPSGERVGAKPLAALELEQPAAFASPPGLGCLALELGDPRDAHEVCGDKMERRNQ